MVSDGARRVILVIILASRNELGDKTGREGGGRVKLIWENLGCPGLWGHKCFVSDMAGLEYASGEQRNTLVIVRYIDFTRARRELLLFSLVL